MPIVTVDPNDFERFELASAPADPNDPTDLQGYVMLRPLPFGMKITRSDKALRYSMQQKTPQDHKMKKGDESSTILNMEAAGEWATHYDFAYCIGDHNLTDNRKIKINFADPMSLKQLNPKVGTEIAALIDKLNEDEDAESAEDLVRRAIGSSEESTNSLMEDSSIPTAEVLNVT